VLNYLPNAGFYLLNLAFLGQTFSDKKKIFAQFFDSRKFWVGNSLCSLCCWLHGARRFRCEAA